MWAICPCVATLKSGSTAAEKGQRQPLPVATISNGGLAGRVARVLVAARLGEQGRSRELDGTLEIPKKAA